ncbi:hypothetical protein RHSIM_Rhsim03G0102600 [Rhododendron simsii]|uniref:non-specific serine/threonine protein kinase n=1 Tax=Rhododendron simsii TaxID=118357 RepID=A0A834HD03_RHOSS|nr:hypothetical protein RHSIM_Rhsim03G0102600 [Rhododendron simsii]
MHEPSKLHYAAAKHILRYLQGTKKFGINFDPAATSTFSGNASLRKGLMPPQSGSMHQIEVVVALEYLHMLGIVYRDLKPENILVRANGHIMLTDFDLCLNCMPPSCIASAVSWFRPKRKRCRNRPGPHGSQLAIVAEPIDARSMSFIGTYEYLAPEIILGKGHGSAVDWWTLRIFIFEFFYGVTPFKGTDHEHTLANIGARALDFPKKPPLAEPAKDLIRRLLIKDPKKRMGSTMGATTIKRHPFFDRVNWALLGGVMPPFFPWPMAYQTSVARDNFPNASIEYY